MHESEIFINQIGYRPRDNKIAFVSQKAKGKAESFSVFDSVKNKEVFSGLFQKAPDDKLAGGTYYLADFSDLNICGEFFVLVNCEKSFSFKISERIYDEIQSLALNYFTQARCGQGVCHTGLAEIYGTSAKKNVQGGWHDAGDYGRYVVAGTKAIMDLLLAYKKAPAAFGDFDLFGEVRFELEWLLEMQREDGAVYHKISCYHFCDFIMPQEEKDRLVIAPVSTAATADFAGCLAYAANFYKKSDCVFAKTLLDAAIKAQNYLFSHDDDFYINPPEITTGGYGDRDVCDERYFALCSLFCATKDENYLLKAMKIRSEKKNSAPDLDFPWNSGWREVFSWAFVTGYGTEILLENENLLSAEILAEIQSGIITQAEDILCVCNESAFKYSSKTVFWGSNGAICDLAHVLLMAYDFTGRKAFFDAAKNQLDYILGCNPLNFCFLTGVGTKSPKNPHHRPSGASGRVYKGMLAGGACSTMDDEYAKEHFSGIAPLKCYADVQPSYSTNEVAIYWNSAFVYLLSRII
ncbi:MAG: glycoside hydrolase family 9 protein [Treponema sp.]|nr:glycoside hydrolase family 9 protein [Treponema sp.]